MVNCCHCDKLKWPLGPVSPDIAQSSVSFHLQGPTHQDQLMDKGSQGRALFSRSLQTLRQSTLLFRSQPKNMLIIRCLPLLGPYMTTQHTRLVAGSLVILSVKMLSLQHMSVAWSFPNSKSTVFTILLI